MVTALFCDLVGSTELSGVLEPETLRAVVLRYFDAMRAGIEARGGTVEKFIGDAVVAVFGVPRVREDDARRAASAALGMIEALEELNDELEREVGSTLAVRIGVNSGEVVTSGEVADGTMVSGEVVNVAARLEQAAPPGQILIGPTTRLLLGAAARVEPVGSLTLRGKRDPVSAFRLTGLAPGGAPPDTRPPATPFVDRSGEYRWLTDARASVAARGGSRLVRVTGEAGVGKSRLLREWLAELIAEGALVGSARCRSHGDEASLTPLADALASLLRRAASDGTEAAGDALPPAAGEDWDGAYEVLHGGLLADGTPSPSLGATWAAVASVLAGLSRRGPVVLVLDDVQWARPLLRDGLRTLGESLADRPVLLVCSGRQAEGGPPESSRAPDLAELRLEPLSETASHRLAAALTATADGGSELSEEVRRAVVRRAEGNPLHLEQLLAWAGDGADPAELPVTVTAVLAARIDALEEAERAVLDAGAVLGRRFTTDDVRTLLTDTPHEGAVAGALGGLVRRGLVERVAGTPPTHQFRSGLLRDVTYQGLSKRRRAAWHERLAARPGTGAAVTAHHLEQSCLHLRELGQRGPRAEELRSRTAVAFVDAGRHALARADLSWAADLYERGLAHGGPDDVWWTAAAQGLGESWIALGRTDDGDALIRRVLEVSAAAGDDRAHAHARLQLAVTDPEGDQGTAAEAARAGLPVFRAAGDRLGQARAYVRLAQDMQVAGRHQAAGALLAAALGHAMAAEATPERALALGALAVSLWHGPTPAADAVARCRDLLAEHGPGNAVATVTIGYPLANLLALRGHIGEARAWLTTADRLAAGLGYAEAACFGPLFAAGVEMCSGRPERAEPLLREAIDRCRALGATTLHASASRDLARARLARGLAPGSWLTDREPGALRPADAADHHGVRALTAAGAGDTALALALARRAVAEADTTDSPISRGAARLDLARVHAAAGRGVAARHAAEAAARMYEDKGHAVGLAAAREVAAGAFGGAPAPTVEGELR